MCLLLDDIDSASAIASDRTDFGNHDIIGAVELSEFVPRLIETTLKTEKGLGDPRHSSTRTGFDRLGRVNQLYVLVQVRE